MDLRTCLSAANWRTLCAIAATNRLRLEPRPSKQRLVEALEIALGKRVRSSGFAGGLDAGHLALLEALAVSGGSLALADVAAVYGPLRGLSGTGEADPRRLARYPASPAESLLFQGLIYVMPGGSPAGDRLVLPAEWLPLFRPCSAAPALDAGGEPTHPWTDISLALAVYLASLQSAPGRLSVDGRLSATTVRRLAALLRAPLVEGAVERQARPLAFLRYLGERLDLLLAHNKVLTPSPAAAAWLEETATARLASIWRVLLADTSANHALWRQYRLPGRPLRQPILFAQRLVDRVAACTDDGAAWLTLADLVPPADDGLLLGDLVPWWERERHPALARETAWDLLSGPLAWLGVTDVRDAPAPVWRLTPLGRWLIGQAPLPPEPPPQPMFLDATMPKRDTDPFVVWLPQSPRLPALLALADWADPLLNTPDDPTLVRFEITPASVRRAMAGGARVDDLLHLLMQEAQPEARLLEDVARKVRSWADGLQPCTVHPLWVLTAPSARRLDDVLDRRALRRHLGRRLSPTEVEIDLLHVEGLLSALRQRRYPVAISGALENTTADVRSPRRRSPGDLAPADLTWLLTALQAYAHLAHRLHLPSPPEAVADRLAAWADDRTRDIARAGADLAGRSLDRALADLDPTLAPMPSEALLPLLQDAIEREAAITLRYWTPTRPLPTARRVEPRRIEWRGDTPYLVAYCHLQMAERTFRLDRVIEAGPPTQS